MKMIKIVHQPEIESMDYVASYFQYAGVLQEKGLGRHFGFLMNIYLILATNCQLPKSQAAQKRKITRMSNYIGRHKNNQIVFCVIIKFLLFLSLSFVLLYLLLQRLGKQKSVWYGIRWIENEQGIESIHSDGDEYLHKELPIQNKMRRCLVYNGKVVYYLDENNSYFKEDGTEAVLDGQDGDVCVEVPDFFYQFTEKLNARGNREITLKISQTNICGFEYSPKMFVGAYEATIDRENNFLASVCTSNFIDRMEEVIIASDECYIQSINGKSLGVKKTAEVSGYTANAKRYRGGNNNSEYDDIMNPKDTRCWLNCLGRPAANLCRDECRKMEDKKNGKMMYLYDAHKALWILSMIEYKCKNIQNEDTGLGYGATVWPSYSAFKTWRNEHTEAVLPCGITNILGNHSGEVFICVKNVPVSIEGGYPDADPSTIALDNVWVPCVSYRGIENYWGHIYKIVDQINIICESAGKFRSEDNREIYDVWYYYQPDPYDTDNKCRESQLVKKVTFCPIICNTSSYIFGQEGHILPCDTAIYEKAIIEEVSTRDKYTSEETYCDCVEYGINYRNGGGITNGCKWKPYQLELTRKKYGCQCFSI